ncbi:putative signal peptide protein [Puccinia sorghi]|uniref:Putative signal peptide protein n=1 Tax=Puccinia sorghi TaxID=27349 RepID=A0A0L6VJ20_9BASI|nr:putative signal peptide protein [Puccinia sorghi]
MPMSSASSGASGFMMMSFGVQAFLLVTYGPTFCESVMAAAHKFYHIHPRLSFFNGTGKYLDECYGSSPSFQSDWIGDISMKLFALSSAVVLVTATNTTFAATKLHQTILRSSPASTSHIPLVEPSQQTTCPIIICHDVGLYQQQKKKHARFGSVFYGRGGDCIFLSAIVCSRVVMYICRLIMMNRPPEASLSILYPLFLLPVMGPFTRACVETYERSPEFCNLNFYLFTIHIPAEKNSESNGAAIKKTIQERAAARNRVAPSLVLTGMPSAIHEVIFFLADRDETSLRPLFSPWQVNRIEGDISTTRRSKVLISCQLCLFLSLPWWQGPHSYPPVHRAFPDATRTPIFILTLQIPRSRYQNTQELFNGERIEAKQSGLVFFFFSGERFSVSFSILVTSLVFTSLWTTVRLCWGDSQYDHQCNLIMLLILGQYQCSPDPDVLRRISQLRMKSRQLKKKKKRKKAKCYSPDIPFWLPVRCNLTDGEVHKLNISLDCHQSQNAYKRGSAKSLEHERDSRIEASKTATARNPPLPPQGKLPGPAQSFLHEETATIFEQSGRAGSLRRHPTITIASHLTLIFRCEKYLWARLPTVQFFSNPLISCLFFFPLFFYSRVFASFPSGWFDTTSAFFLSPLSLFGVYRSLTIASSRNSSLDRHPTYNSLTLFTRTVRILAIHSWDLCRLVTLSSFSCNHPPPPPPPFTSAFGARSRYHQGQLKIIKIYHVTLTDRRAGRLSGAVPFWGPSNPLDLFIEREDSVAPPTALDRCLLSLHLVSLHRLGPLSNSPEPSLLKLSPTILSSTTLDYPSILRGSPNWHNSFLLPPYTHLLIGPIPGFSVVGHRETVGIVLISWASKQSQFIAYLLFAFLKQGSPLLMRIFHPTSIQDFQPYPSLPNQQSANPTSHQSNHNILILPSTFFFPPPSLLNRPHIFKLTLNHACFSYKELQNTDRNTLYEVTPCSYQHIHLLCFGSSAIFLLTVLGPSLSAIHHPLRLHTLPLASGCIVMSSGTTMASSVSEALGFFPPSNP